MGRNKSQGMGGRPNNKRKNKLKDLPDKGHLKEFGEAHPLDDVDTSDRTNVKRIKVEDTDEYEKKDRLSDIDMSSEDDAEETDAVSRLLATFNADTNTAVDSDESSDEEDNDESSDEDDNAESSDEDDNDVVIGDEISSSDDLDIPDGFDGESENEEEEDDDDDDDDVDDDDDDEDNNDKDDLESKGSPMLEQNKGEILESSQNGENDEEELEDDPFRKHFELNIRDDIAEDIMKSESWSSTFEEWPVLNRMKVDLPKVEVKQPKLLLLAKEDEENELPNIGTMPKPPRRKNFNLESYHVVNPLRENVLLVSSEKATCSSGLTEKQKALFAIMSNYSDLYYPEATHEIYEDIRVVYALHSLNHSIKTRKRVMRHNAKLKKKANKKSKSDPEQCFRDQGYARPRVLIIVPFKHSAYRLVSIMAKLMEEKNFEVFKQQRFDEDYGPGEEFETQKDVRKRTSRAEDFQEVFKGKSDEDFKIGIKLTKKTLKLYSDFYESDIIIASPLGLRRLMGSFNLSSSETDFLTSIEILIIDQADVLMMQNWEHLLVLMEVMNKPPHDIHKLKVDLTRVRLWSLDGHSSLYRQTMLFSAAHIDHNRALINKCKNFAGRVQVLNPVKDGSIQEVVISAELVLIRVAGKRDPDSRFNYFVNKVLPQYQANRRTGVMVYIPDYCDYVRVMKYLKEDGGVNFASINEYIIGEMAKLAKIRSVFFDGKRQFLLYTERFHFYRRCIIKGVRHVIFYDLPTYPHFFSEICNLMVAGNQNRRTESKHIGNSTVSVLYQQSDLTKLVGVLGTQRASEISKAQKSIHICVIGS